MQQVCDTLHSLCRQMDQLERACFLHVVDHAITFSNFRSKATWPAVEQFFGGHKGHMSVKQSHIGSYRVQEVHIGPRVHRDRMKEVLVRG